MIVDWCAPTPRNTYSVGATNTPTVLDATGDTHNNPAPHVTGHAADAIGAAPVAVDARPQLPAVGLAPGGQRSTTGVSA
jgi:hypothetical protein